MIEEVFAQQNLRLYIPDEKQHVLFVLLNLLFLFQLALFLWNEIFHYQGHRRR
jgi:hypothetical protein